MNRFGVMTGAALLSLASGTALAEVTANGAVANNYIWRGLTQTINEPAVQGGLDYVNDNGFYIGTWASNVSYESDDAFAYEHDVYFGYSGGNDDFSWDVGYLYYNYDDSVKFDFSEIYGSIGVGGFSATLYLLADTEQPESPGVPELDDFGFGSAYYLSLDYGFELENGLGISFHIGQHDGDFVESFNVIATTDLAGNVIGDTSYIDYNVTFSVGNFSFMITDTDLDEPTATTTCFACERPRDNAEPKFVLSYGMDFEL